MIIQWILRWLFKKKANLSDMPTMSKQNIIEELGEDILIHELWAVKVTQSPKLADDFGDYDWHMHWIEVYKNSIYYLQEG